MKKFFNIGLVRGLIFQIFGTFVGIGLVSGIRALLGLQVWVLDQVSFGFSEGAWVVGGLFGTLAFLYGTRVLDDWIKWAKIEQTYDHHEDPPGLRKYFGPSLDHKVIGVQYVVTAILVMGFGGLFAVIFRTELAESGLQVLTKYFELVDPTAGADAIRVQALNLYNTLMSLHGILMIVSILLGIAGMMNYLVPLMIGAEDMAFPRLNAFSFWLAPPAAILLLSSLLLGGFDTGWTGYPPLSARAPVGVQMFFLGVFVAGWSSILGGLNLIATVPDAHFCLGGSCHLDHFLDCNSTHWSFISAGDVPAVIRDGLFRSDKGRQPGSIPAFILVLFPSCRICFCPPWIGNHFRIITGICPETTVWLPVGCDVFPRYCPGWIPGLGTPYLHFSNERVSASAFYVQHFIGRHPYWGKVLFVGGDDLEGKNRNTHTNVICAGRFNFVFNWWAYRSAKRDGFY